MPVTIPATLDFLRRDPDCSVVLVGREELLAPAVAKAGNAFGARLKIHHASEVVEMHDPLAIALRKVTRSRDALASPELSTRCASLGPLPAKRLPRPAASTITVVGEIIVGIELGVAQAAAARIA